jgi:peptidoglycan/LPS O-acetylase OafA/YrhL
MTPFAFASSHAVRLDRWLGNASYGMYVSHFAVYKFLSLFLAETTLKIVYLPALVIAGLLIARFIEQPIDRLRDAIGRRAVKRRVDLTPGDAQVLELDGPHPLTLGAGTGRSNSPGP